MIQPLHDNVVVKRDKAEEKKTPGGIVVPAKNNTNPDTATVIAIGPDVNGPIDAGSKILIGRFSGCDLTEDGIEIVTIIPWKDILGIVK
jgi:chaperonin GroES